MTTYVLNKNVVMISERELYGLRKQLEKLEIENNSLLKEKKELIRENNKLVESIQELKIELEKMEEQIGKSTRELKREKFKNEMAYGKDDFVLYKDLPIGVRFNHIVPWGPKLEFVRDEGDLSTLVANSKFTFQVSPNTKIKKENIVG